jgi:hypothetical protein
MSASRELYLAWTRGRGTRPADGNFEGDSPRDYLADMVSVWERIIDHALAGEMKELAVYFGPEARPLSERGQEAIDSVVMPTAEVMIAVAERFECDYLPSPEKVSGWAAEALRVFDAEGGDDWDDTPERRRVIEEIFDRLLRIVERRADEGPPSESGPSESHATGAIAPVPAIMRPSGTFLSV